MRLCVQTGCQLISGQMSGRKLRNQKGSETFGYYLAGQVTEIRMLQGISGILIKRKFLNLVNDMLVMEKGNSLLKMCV